MIICYFVIGLVYSITALGMNIRQSLMGEFQQYNDYKVWQKVVMAVMDGLFWPLSVAMDIYRTVIIIIISFG